MHKYIIYMASGSGRRFGSNKLLEPLSGRPLFRHGLDTLISASRLRDDCSIIVVSRYQQILSYAEHKNLNAVYCPESENGISHTIRAGIMSIHSPEKTDYLMFAAADQPRISERSVNALLDKADGLTVTARLFFRDTPGNPVLFSAGLVPELLALRGDRGGGSIACRCPCIPVQVSDRHELGDIDTHDDLCRYHHT